MKKKTAEPFGMQFLEVTFVEYVSGGSLPTGPTGSYSATSSWKPSTSSGADSDMMTDDYSGAGSSDYGG